jgi:hypothetical protein
MKREIEIEIEELPFRERDKNISGGKKTSRKQDFKGKFAFRLVPTTSGGDLLVIVC